MEVNKMNRLITMFCLLMMFFLLTSAVLAAEDNGTDQQSFDDDCVVVDNDSQIGDENLSSQDLTCNPDWIDSYMTEGLLLGDANLVPIANVNSDSDNLSTDSHDNESHLVHDGGDANHFVMGELVPNQSQDGSDYLTLHSGLNTGYLLVVILVLLFG